MSAIRLGEKIPGSPVKGGNGLVEEKKAVEQYTEPNTEVITSNSSR